MKLRSSLALFAVVALVGGSLELFSSEKEIILITKKGCPACNALKQGNNVGKLRNKTGVPVKILDIDDNLDQIKQLGLWVNAFPTILVRVNDGAGNKTTLGKIKGFTSMDDLLNDLRPYLDMD